MVWKTEKKNQKMCLASFVAPRQSLYIQANATLNLFKCFRPQKIHQCGMHTQTMHNLAKPCYLAASPFSIQGFYFFCL